MQRIVKMTICVYKAVHHHEVPEGIIELKSGCPTNVRPWSIQKSTQQHMDLNHGITQLPKYRLFLPSKFAPLAVKEFVFLISLTLHINFACTYFYL